MTPTVKNLPAAQETCVRSLGKEDPLEEVMTTHFSILAWRIPMDRGAWGVQSLGGEDPLEKGMATSSSTVAWRIPMDREAWRATVHESQRVRHD